MKKKQCNKCNLKKILEDFPKKKDTDDKRSARCKLCCREDCHQYYLKNKSTQLKKKNDRVKSIRIRNRKFIYEFLLKNSCVVCGEKEPCTLQFDHIKDKKYNVSALAQSTKSISVIQNEIEKCQVLCANCHAKKTAKDQLWYKDLEDETISSCKELSK